MGFVKNEWKIIVRVLQTPADVIDKLFGSGSQAAQTKINMPSLATRQLMSLATRVTQYLHGMLKNYVVSVSVQFNDNTNNPHWDTLRGIQVSSVKRATGLGYLGTGKQQLINLL